ncbi:MAG: glutamine synthetase III [Clostridia bacterium]|nr:glutamine synthetase III [Clostridia bacterium]
MNISEIFGEMVFNETVMKERLPEETYKALKDTIRVGSALDEDVAGIVATAMKDWAIEKGATHYTHWFQPLTGITAEKHDSFISPKTNGTAIMDFSAKELIKGEPDASSFPSGGLRVTFEARGYTAWDPTSYAFIKDETLCIPTVFCSYSGEALDKKTPLLRSMQLIDREALRVLKLFGHNDVKHINANAGAEQEYFLVAKELFDLRKDLIFCSRTLFGAKPPKGQELDDHYFGALQPDVKLFMRDLDNELWRLGVYAKTEHKEAAPGQYELAPVYSGVNTATDHNQLTMEIMKKVALRHGFVCLLHEKPFAGLNGSGKHNNWSLSTDTGKNLFSPGSSPQSNTLFLLFLCAVIKGVDEYQDLLRASIASAGNDLRLGAQEAPPSIVSIFLGDDLEGVLTSIEAKEDYEAGTMRTLESGVNVLPHVRLDNTDRNRTSPFAFTGNKFEFRMPGSSHSIADANTVINTIVAESLRIFADELENAQDINSAAYRLIRKTVREHKRILYSGNNYSEEWVKEAERRGLSNRPTTVDALESLILEKNVELLTRHGIYTQRELQSRYEISLESYSKLIRIEANTMLEMTRKEIFPAVLSYEKLLSETINSKKLACAASTAPEEDLLKRIAEKNTELYSACIRLKEAITEASKIKNNLKLAQFCRDSIILIMNEVRSSADALEELTAKDFWPFPTYEDLLFNF